jgi:hypothetical protein
MKCGYTVCRYNKDKDCTHEDKGAECHYVSKSVLDVNDGCEFCCEDEPNEIKIKNDTWMLLCGKGKSAALYHQYESYSHFFGFPINYCPICGRKLT